MIDKTLSIIIIFALQSIITYYAYHICFAINITHYKIFTLQSIVKQISDIYNNNQLQSKYLRF